MSGEATADAIEDLGDAGSRFLIEKNADAILVVDLDGIVLSANPAAEQLLERPAAKLVGSIFGLPLVAGEAAEVVLSQRAGETFDVEMRAVAIRRNGGNAILVSLRDISGRQLIDDRLRQAAKMEAVGRLTAGIAHDFNNLLTVVIGNLDTIRHDPTDPRSVGRAAENALTGAIRAANLTQRLLAFSRNQPSDAKPVAVNEIVAGMIDLLRRTLSEGMSIEVDLAAGPDWIQVAPVELETALLNLALNARDAMPSGGKLFIATRNVTIDEAAATRHAQAAPGAYVSISVTDTGIGMTRDVADHVFEPFFTTKEIGRGTGLGLSQVYNLVRQSGGHIDIDSQPGAGTAVRMYFPALPRDDESILRDEGLPFIPRGLSGETILVVEDDADVRNYSVATLRSLGYRILEAANGAAALQIIENTPRIDLLFSDVGLKLGMDGPSLAKQARLLRPALKALLTTGYLDIDPAQFAPDRPVDLISKPFTIAEIAVRVRQLLDSDSTTRILLVESDNLVRDTLREMLSELGCVASDIVAGGDIQSVLTSPDERQSAALVDFYYPVVGYPDIVTALRAFFPDLPLVVVVDDTSRHLEQRFADDKSIILLVKPFDLRMLRGALEFFSVSVDERQADPSRRPPRP